MMMIKLKNVLNEQEYVAKATNDFFSDNQKKIYEHVLAALAEQLKMMGFVYYITKYTRIKPLTTLAKNLPTIFFPFFQVIIFL